MNAGLPPPKAMTIEAVDFPQLIGVLKTRGYRVIGPQVRDGAIVYDDLESAQQLPAGWTDEQDAGRYRIRHRDDGALFGYAVGPHSWKKFLFPPATRLWSAKRTGATFEVQDEPDQAPVFAFIGVRACELHAIAIQDKVFMGGGFTDPTYRARRSPAFIVALNCGVAGGTCFCVSMKTGPKAASGYDLALTETIENGRHYFLIETGSAAGAEVLAAIPHRLAQTDEQRAARQVVENTAAHMGRTMDSDGLKDLLHRNYEHPRWRDVAARCLTCANCTMVCPTCFCSTIEDTTDLTGENAERWRRWDSCFTIDFSHLAGGSVRNSAKARYRQWMTHKLATWHDQFATSGCVGCGRCITWCPVGIDLTEEVAAIRRSPSASEEAPHTQI